MIAFFIFCILLHLATGFAGFCAVGGVIRHRFITFVTLKFFALAVFVNIVRVIGRATFLAFVLAGATITLAQRIADPYMIERIVAVDRLDRTTHIPALSAGARRANHPIAIAAGFAICIAAARRTIRLGNARTRRGVQFFASPVASQITTIALTAVTVLSVATLGTIGTRRAVGFSNTRTCRGVQLFASPGASQIATIALASVAILSVATFGAVGTRRAIGFGNTRTRRGVQLFANAGASLITRLAFAIVAIFSG